MSTRSELRPLTELRRRMIEDLQLHGYSERTQEMYVRAVRQLAEHYHKPPDHISEEDSAPHPKANKEAERGLRQYFLYIKNVKNGRAPVVRLRYAVSSSSSSTPSSDSGQRCRLSGHTPRRRSR